MIADSIIQATNQSVSTVMTIAETTNKYGGETITLSIIIYIALGFMILTISLISFLIYKLSAIAGKKVDDIKKDVINKNVESTLLLHDIEKTIMSKLSVINEIMGLTNIDVHEINKIILDKEINAIMALQEAIMGLYVIINENKKYVLIDFKYISPISTAKTILEIYRQCCIIIDKNNLVENNDNIQLQIPSMVESVVENGRAYLSRGNFDSNLINSFTSSTDKLKKMATKEISDAFKDAGEQLAHYEIGLKEIDNYFLNCNGFDKPLIVEYKEKLHEKQLQKRRVYLNLKVRIWTVFESIMIENEKKIREM